MFENSLCAGPQISCKVPRGRAGNGRGQTYSSNAWYEWASCRRVSSHDRLLQPAEAGQHRFRSRRRTFAFRPNASALALFACMSLSVFLQPRPRPPRHRKRNTEISRAGGLFTGDWAKKGKQRLRRTCGDRRLELWAGSSSTGYMWKSCSLVRERPRAAGVGK